MCIYMRACQEEKKCCVLFLDEGGKRVCPDTAKKEVSSQRFIALEKSNLMGSYLTEMMESFLLQ